MPYLVQVEYGMEEEGGHCKDELRDTSTHPTTASLAHVEQI